MWPLGHAGLTLATSLGAIFNAGCLYWFLRRQGWYAPRPGWFSFLCKLIIALGVLAALLFWLSGPSSFWLNAGLWAKVARLAGLVFAGAGAYLAALFLLGFRLRDFNRRE